MEYALCQAGETGGVFSLSPVPGKNGVSMGRSLGAAFQSERLHTWKCCQYCSLVLSRTGHDDVSPQSEVVFPALLGLYTGYLRALLPLSPKRKSEEMGILLAVTEMCQHLSSSEKCDTHGVCLEIVLPVVYSLEPTGVLA